MYRRRRTRNREIAFSFDSFLDVVANVMGIILRLILVAWVGARTYTGLFPAVAPTVSPVTEPEAAVVRPPRPVVSTAAEQAALHQAEKRLAEARSTLLTHLRQQEELQSKQARTQRQRTELAAQMSQLSEKAALVENQLREAESEQQQAQLSLQEIQARSAALEKEIAELKKLPIVKQIHRYQTPMARTVQSEEIQFEIQEGQVCFIDVDALIRDVKQNLRTQAEQLRSRWELQSETAPVGPFKLRYVLVRERNLIEDVTSPTQPDDRADFRYGLSSWEAVPVAPVRGETLEQALAEGSQFRRIIDRLDATQTAVTFWVYPESFAVYRQLRDYCLRRELLVAGRPLPTGFPIASSRKGTASRGQ